MSLSQYELAQIVEALDTIRKRLDALEAAQTDASMWLRPRRRRRLRRLSETTR